VVCSKKRGKNRKENIDRNLLIIGVIGEIIIKKNNKNKNKK